MQIKSPYLSVRAFLLVFGLEGAVLMGEYGVTSVRLQHTLCRCCFPATFRHRKSGSVSLWIGLQGACTTVMVSGFATGSDDSSVSTHAKSLTHLVWVLLVKAAATFVGAT